MSQGTLRELLELLRQPSGLTTIAQRLSVPAGVLRGLLAQLEARGLITTAEPGVGACRSGCSSCSMESFCASSSSQQEPSQLLPKALVWRLTPLGEAQLVSS